MTTSNKIFIATSLDGYIADENGKIDWLHALPNPTGDDMGYQSFMDEVDALVMGRNTYETVLGFDMDWPYSKPVFVLSSSITSVPEEIEDKIFIKKGDLNQIMTEIHQAGFKNLYIDGGTTIQGFLEHDLIDEMIITTIPVLLGGGVSLFGQLDQQLAFTCVASKRFINAVAQNHYKRNRK
ncbi:MAG: dihydrofolate reductase family protein [Crocinitomicaceae bacterium]